MKEIAYKGITLCLSRDAITKQLLVDVIRIDPITGKRVWYGLREWDVPEEVWTDYEDK